MINLSLMYKDIDQYIYIYISDLPSQVALCNDSIVFFVFNLQQPIAPIAWSHSTAPNPFVCSVMVCDGFMCSLVNQEMGFGYISI